ncbi:BstXI family restriction endonuclease [Aliarcobacter butzleri]|uniref:BstXI family restriction endonuclease n=1 Tax=Aliarcobacter butzleri TaxID=28197 RepID=UPI003AFA7C11
MPPREIIPRLPKFIETKIYKTGQTRGADDDVIFQNRVGRNSTVLIPYAFYEQCINALGEGNTFENGFIVLIPPELYFNNTDNILRQMQKKEIVLGVNALLFYDKRTQWEAHNPFDLELRVATSRTAPLGGTFVSRVASTTAENVMRENHGFTTSGMKGAGIRIFEYASSEMINLTRIQLEYLFWSCYDSIEMCVEYGITSENAIERKNYNQIIAEEHNLTNLELMISSRMLNQERETVCPLCLERLSSQGFFEKVAQAEGRNVHDLTVTQINLFHINEVRVGQYNHKIYNLSWGHHHCNVVVKDSGIEETLTWMREVIVRNDTLLQ